MYRTFLPDYSSKSTKIKKSLNDRIQLSSRLNFNNDQKYQANQDRYIQDHQMVGMSGKCFDGAKLIIIPNLV